MPVQDCLLVNLRETGSFKLTAQRLADIHTVTVNINFPSDPQSGDMHLVDYDGDNWWVLYRYGAGVWTLYAEIEGQGAEGGQPNVIWVNSEANSSISRVHDINRPYATLEDAINEIPTGSLSDSVLQDIVTNSYYEYYLIPNNYQVKVVGGNLELTNLGISNIDPDKFFRLEIEKSLSVEDGGDLSSIFNSVFDLKGSGILYQKNSTTGETHMFTPSVDISVIDVDLNSIFFETGSNSLTSVNSIFNLSESQALTNIRLKHSLLSKTGLVTMPCLGNKGLNIDIDKVSIVGSYNYVILLPDVNIGATVGGKNTSNINIGSITDTEFSISSLLKAYSGTLYGHQNLNVSVGLIENSSLGYSPLLWFLGGDYSGTNINVDINSFRGLTQGLTFANTDFNGTLNYNINKYTILGSYPVNVILAFLTVQSSNINSRVSITGFHRGSMVVSGTSEISDLFISGEYYTYIQPTTGGTSTPFIRFSSSTAVYDHKIYLNNCKIIVENSSSSLVDEIGSAMAGTLTLVCSNVHTNAMGALPGWVTIEGDLTQNVNYL